MSCFPSQFIYNSFSSASGDGSKWLIATVDAVIGDWYENEKRDVEKSSINSTRHKVKWNRRTAEVGDPRISLKDHRMINDKDELDMLYAENSSPTTKATLRKGANVYIRLKNIPLIGK